MRITGLEPARRSTPEPKSGASANSAIPAGEISIPFLRVFVNLDDMLIGSGALAKRGNLR